MEIKIGDRIKLLGTVYEIKKVNFDGGFTQIWCNFENGSNFAIVPEVGDIYEVIS